VDGAARVLHNPKEWNMKKARRQWSSADKARLVRQFRAAPNKKDFARENGLRDNMLYRWQRKTAEAPPAKRAEAVPARAAVTVVADGALNKLREDNDILRRLVHRAMQNGFLRDLFE